MKQIEVLEREIGLIQAECEENFKPLTYYTKQNNISEKNCDYLLQTYGYRDCDGNWREDFMEHGYITATSYIAFDPNTGMNIRCKNEFVGPHPGAHEFFAKFFKLAM